MTLPLVDRDPIVLTPRSVQLPLTCDDTVAEALARLQAAGDTAAVVMRDGRPCAVVTRRAIEEASATGDADAPLGRVADFLAVPVDRSADALATVQAFTRAAWTWLRTDTGR